MITPYVIALALSLAPGIEGEPTAIWSQAPHTLEVRSLPDLFLEASVQENLTNGLSTTLVGTTSYRGSDGRDHTRESRARIRFDLWDEVFVVDSFGFGKDGTFQIVDEAALIDWWRSCRITFQREEGSQPPSQVRVRLVVLPFSQSEEEDARLWFSRSARRAGTRGPNENTSEINTFLEQVMATSIKREKLLSYDLKIVVQEAESEP